MSLSPCVYKVGYKGAQSSNHYADATVPDKFEQMIMHYVLR